MSDVSAPTDSLGTMSRHAIVPPYLLARIAVNDTFPHAARAARATLEAPDEVGAARSQLRLSVEGGALIAETAPAPSRTIWDARHRERLPGEIVRREDDPPTADPAVTEAFDGLGATFAFFAQAYGRDAIDGVGGPLWATVHYGIDYDNAFWDGARMVFGDGDGEVFHRFTGSLSVIAHELSHGVIEHAGGLIYRDQSGALNESIADVFGALTEQHARDETAADATWLIGPELFTDEVEGRALRSLAAPGTAYDDDVLGRDPQPGHMDDYVHTDEDHGGVHINSGIPNRAFHIVATALGGRAWERAGFIWYRTLVAQLSPTTDFASFAAATLRTARAEYGEGSQEADAVRTGWDEVGVHADGRR